MLFPRLLTQHTSEAMHVQGNDGQSNTSGKSLWTFRPNTVEATVFKIVQRFPIKFKLSGPAANLGARHGPAGIVRFGGTAVLFRRLPGR